MTLVAGIYTGIFSFISRLSYVFINGLGLSPTQYGFSFAAVVLGNLAGSFIAGRLSQRLRIERMLNIGLAICFAGSVPMTVLALTGPFNLATVIAPFFIFMVGLAMSMPNAMAGAIGPFPRMAGLASSLLVGFIQMGRPPSSAWASAFLPTAAP